MAFSLITPSYAPDFERCRLLCESVDRFARGATHYVVVDRRDERQFAPLRSHSREVMSVESILPPWIFRVPGAKRWWMSLRTRPLRNWVLQQLVKLSMSDVVQTDVMVYVDSDVTFVRPFGIERFMQGDRLRLNRVDFQSPQHAEWLCVAADLLGTDPAAVPAVNYVASLVPWRRRNLQRLHEHLAGRSGRQWIEAVAARKTFSEYMIYGLFVEQVMGFDEAGHVPMDSPVLHLSWGHDLTQPAGVDRYLDELGPKHIGLMIHSKDAIPLAHYAQKVRAIWNGPA